MKHAAPELFLQPRYIDNGLSDAINGTVSWQWRKSLWFCAHLLVVLWGGFYTFSLENSAVFLILTAGVLCFGHSLGMHRRLIHQSYACKKWLEYILVYLGTLVGLGGPISMIKTHDIRDWAQRKLHCHDYFAHRQSMMRDFWWQVHCDVALDNPPTLMLEASVARNKFYQFIEKTPELQQLPWAILFYLLGVWGYVIWGISARLVACIFGHWLVGYYAHRQGQQHWVVNDAGVQGFNIGIAKWFTFGECWHNNHHAFPQSARLGHHPHEVDAGWWILLLFAKVGWVWNIQLPQSLPVREALVKKMPISG